MTMKSILLCLLVSLSFLTALTLPNEARKVIEREPRRSFTSWERIGRLQRSLEEDLTLTIALKQRNLDLLERKVLEVSNPMLPSYGHYLTFEEVRYLVAPDPSVVDNIIDWFKQQGIEKSQMKLHESGDFLTIKLSVAKAEELLQTEYHTFVHSSGKKYLKAMESYSLPISIADKIDFISGFRLPNLRLPLKKRGNVSLRGASGNGPILVYVNPLDEIAQLTFLPLCNNGESTTVFPLCSNTGNAIKSFKIYVNQTRYSQITTKFQVEESNCKSCNSSEGHFSSSCNEFIIKNNLPTNTIFCEITLNNLNNYAVTTFSLRSTYEDESHSDIYVDSAYRITLGKFVTPQEIWKQYNIPPNIAVSSPFNSQSVAEFLGQFYSSADLRVFFQLMGLPDQTANVDVIGPNNQTLPGGEASLDIQYIMGIANNASTTFWSLSTLDNGQEPFLEWITQVLSTSIVPLVHSISYGDDEDTLTQDYMTRVNAEFMKAAVRGISLFFSSGDSGVFGGESFTCNPFTPSFPASSPYVTTVGATLLTTAYTPLCGQSLFGLPIPCHTVGETTSSTSLGSRITSGGGFSNVFPRPNYQNSVVSQYLKSLNIPSNYYSNKGRGYPDVAALGHNFIVIIGGEIVPVDGTSAAAPTFAAVVTLLNDLRLNNGLPPLGFINPLLYSLSNFNLTHALNDIVTGDNSCSELGWLCCKFGFPASVGWDAVTGLGSPKFDILSNLVTSSKFLGKKK